MESNRPLMLGLVGDSASGKTTLVRGVVRLLGTNGVTPICLDDYHRFTRAELLAQELTAADPAANDLELAAEHLAALRAGRSIRKPVYDHRTGTFRGPEVVAATGLVVAYGMLSLTPPLQADLFDLTVYLEPDALLRQAWRFARDVRERGYTAEEFQARQEARERDAARFIEVQRSLADVVIRFHAASSDEPSGAIDKELIVRKGTGSAPLAAALEVLAQVAPPGLDVMRDIVDDDGRRADRVRIQQGISVESTEAIAAAVGDGVVGLGPDSLAALGQIRREDDLCYSRSLALAQLLIVRCLVAARPGA